MIGVGVARSVGKYWRTACDVFRMYDQLPGLKPIAQATAVAKAANDAPKAASKNAAPKKAAKKAAAKKAAPKKQAERESGSVRLLRRAMQLQSEKSTDGWVSASGLKNQMLRLDAAFDEKTEGHKSFTEFLAAHDDVVETRSVQRVLSVRLRDAG